MTASRCPCAQPDCLVHDRPTEFCDILEEFAQLMGRLTVNRIRNLAQHGWPENYVFNEVFLHAARLAIQFGDAADLEQLQNIQRRLQPARVCWKPAERSS